MRAALAVLGLLASLLATALGSIYREPLPFGRIDAARAALRRARIATPEPEQLAPAVNAAQRLERRLAEEQSIRWRPPRSREVLQLALEAETAALSALRQAEVQDQAGREATAGRRAVLEARLSQLGPEVEQLADRSLRAAFQQARLELEVAAEAEDRGDLVAAGAGLDVAAQELDGVEEGLDRSYSRLRDPELRRRWQGWVDEALAKSRADGTALVVVDKQARRCVLVSAGRIVDRYDAELGRNGLLDKLYSGDLATPEGLYRVTEKRDRGQTQFYRALMLDYPNAEDRREFAEARRRGVVPRGRGIGGLIEIHGYGGKGLDWTNGCVALPNGQMDQLFAAVEVGTPVLIVGTARLPGDPP